MPREDAVKFEQALQASEDLQAKLKAAASNYAGEMSDSAFAEAVMVPLAAEAGFSVTADDIMGITPNGVDLDDDELDAVAGGTGFCLIIGGADDVEAECGRNEGHACAYIGITIIDCTR